MNKHQKAILLLEDGRVFNGSSFGYIGETTGEVCFNTGMSGYQEILTDPSYCKQIVTMTSPHIGNYGINSEDIESKMIQVSGFVIKEESKIPSNWRSELSVGQYLDDQKIVGIQNIDTRMITRVTRMMLSSGIFSVTRMLLFATRIISVYIYIQGYYNNIIQIYTLGSDLAGSLYI